MRIVNSKKQKKMHQPMREGPAVVMTSVMHVQYVSERNRIVFLYPFVSTNHESSSSGFDWSVSMN